MSNGFGYTVPSAAPAPDSRKVGAMLMQQRMAQPHQMQSTQPMAQPMMSPMARDAMLRSEGGKLMGSGGPDNAGWLGAAVGEALTREGGGHRGNPNPFKNRDAHIRQLQQLGVSPLEAALLGETL
jgi:hypothetical protein